MELVSRCLDDFPRLGVDSVVVSGGEPMAFFPEMCQLAALAKERHVSTQICSNGFWATNLDRARKYLSELQSAGLVHLLLSTDRFHLQFVPVERVILAANAASALGISCQIAVPALASDFQALSLLSRLRARTDAAVFTHPVHPIGRGANLPPSSLRWPAPAMDGCSLLGHIEIDWDGTVSCCPPSADFGGSNPLVLGNATDVSLHTLLRRFERTPIFHIISNYGPLGLRYLLEGVGVSTGIDPGTRVHECHLCQSITGSKWLFDEFMRRTGASLLAPQDEGQLEILRGLVEDRFCERADNVRVRHV